MKKTILLFATAILIALSSTSFAATILKLNLEKGKSYKVKSTTQQTIDISANGMQMNIEINSISAISLTPKSIEADYFIAQVKFDSIVTNMSMPQGSMKMNSNKPGNPNNPMEIGGFAMYHLCKNPLEVKMSYSGKVIEIINIKAVNDSINKVVDLLPESSKGQLKPSIEAMASESALKSMIEAITAYLPEKPVDKGDKWESKSALKPNGMELNVTTTYKLKSIVANQAELSGDAVIESGADGTMNMNGMKIPFEMRGISSSELTIDPQTGWIIKGKTKSKLQGSVTFGGNASPMGISGTTEIEAVK